MKRVPWTTGELARVRVLATERKSGREIATELARNIGAVYAFCSRHNITLQPANVGRPRGTQRLCTPGYVAQVLKYHEQGLRAPAIARLLGCKVGTVRFARRYYGLPVAKSGRPPRGATIREEQISE